MKRVNLEVRKDLWREVKVIAAIKGVSLKIVVDEALKHYIQKEKKDLTK